MRGLGSGAGWVWGGTSSWLDPPNWLDPIDGSLQTLGKGSTPNPEGIAAQVKGSFEYHTVPREGSGEEGN